MCSEGITPSVMTQVRNRPGVVLMMGRLGDQCPGFLEFQCGERSVPGLVPKSSLVCGLPRPGSESVSQRRSLFLVECRKCLPPLFVGSRPRSKPAQCSQPDDEARR